MKTQIAYFGHFFNKSTIVKSLIAFFLITSVIFMGCYEWRRIIQPESVAINSYFDAYVCAQGDGNPDNDWTNPDLHDLGLFGVMIPDGWDVQDSIPFTIICTDPSYNNEGILVHSLQRSLTLEDSIPSPDGYFWWGAETAEEASLIYFDSLYFEPRIFTGGEEGQYFLRYAIGDVDYWDRNPADDISDPIPISTWDPVGINELLSNANVSLYPNPVSNQLNIDFGNYKQEVIKMELIDITGKMLMQKQLLQPGNSINLSDLDAGMYFVRLSNGKTSATHKIMVK